MLRTYRLIWEILTPSERRSALLIGLLSIVMALFEVMGVAAILPFMQVVSQPEVIQEEGHFRWLWTTFGFQSVQFFQIFIGAAAFVVIITGMAVRALTVFAITRFSMMRSYSISSRLLSRYLNQPYSWFLSQNSSNLGQNLLYETDKAIIECLQPAFMLVAYVLMLVLVTGFIFVIEPVIALGATILVAGTYAAVYLGFRRKLDQLGTGRYQANQGRFKAVQEATGGIKDVKSRRLESQFVTRYMGSAHRLARLESYSQTIGRLPRFAIEGVVYGGFILLVLAMLVNSDGDLTSLLPLFALIGMAGSKLFPAIQVVYLLTTSMRFMTPSLEKLHSNLTILPPEPADPGPVPALHLRHELVLDEVTFRYAGAEKPVLDRLSLVIPARTTVGVVGGTGAGKTTAIDLLLGLFTPDSGEIRVDGTVIDDRTRPAWQKSIGYVPQSIFLTDDTIAANIAFGVPEAEIDMAAVERAARIANLHDFVTGHTPAGYLTVVGERGVRLSGGQRQRIGIARALYGDPDVLILDEATSALDNLTERAVMEAVHNLGQEKTVIMIAHRLTTVKDCQIIFMLKDGRLADSGSFDELVSRNEIFRRMANA